MGNRDSRRRRQRDQNEESDASKKADDSVVKSSAAGEAVDGSAASSLPRTENDGQGANASSGTGAEAAPSKVRKLTMKASYRVLDISRVFGDKYQGSVWEKYKRVGTLGEGHYGKVHKAKRRGAADGELVAIKTMVKRKLRRPHILVREVEIMLKLDHPNIIKLQEVFEDETEIHLVMDLCTGGELFDRITARGHFSEADAKGIMKTILGALEYCHEQHVCHRDLKPENFLFTSSEEDSTMKIIDFGLSKNYGDDDHSTMRTRVGTPYYIAPEVLERKYDKAVDLWSAGVIMYIVLCGYPPFWGSTDKEIFGRIRSMVVDFPVEEWTGVSDEAKDLIRLLLSKTAADRPTASEALEHPWFAEVAEGQDLHPSVCKQLRRLRGIVGSRRRRCALSRRA